MYKNTASQKIAVFAFDTTTNAAKTGDAANITAYVSKDYGAVTVLTDTTATEMDSTNAKGYYLFDVSQTETNADVLIFSAKSSTANISVIAVPATVFTRPPNFSATSIDSNGRLDIIKVAGTTQTAGDIIGDTNDIQSRLPAALGANGNIKADIRDYNGVAGTFASGRPEVNMSHILGSAVSTTTAQIGVNIVQISADSAAADNLEAYCDGTTPMPVNATQISGDATAADNLEAILDGTGGTGIKVSTLTVTAGVAITNSTLNGHGVSITGNGTGNGLHIEGGSTDGNGIRAIGYDTGAGAWLTGGDSGGTSGLYCDADAAGNGGGIIAQGAGTGYGSWFVGGTDGGGLFLQTGNGAGSIYAIHCSIPGAAAEALNPAFKSELAFYTTEAVWDEPTASHTTAGTTGKALADAGSAGDPWSTALPGAYGAGTAGKILGDNLNATVSSRLASASYTAPLDAAGTRAAVGLASANLDTQLTAIDDFLDTEIAAIKAKTDQLAFTTANRVDCQVFGMENNVMTAAAAAADLTTELQSGLATAAALTTVDTVVDAIKAKTDNLTFTVAGQVDANAESMNGTEILGNGTSGNLWRG